MDQREVDGFLKRKGEIAEQYGPYSHPIMYLGFKDLAMIAVRLRASVGGTEWTMSEFVYAARGLAVEGFIHPLLAQRNYAEMLYEASRTPVC